MDILDIGSPVADGSSQSNATDINIVNSAEISYEYFFKEYLCKNVPCLLKNVSDCWPCQQNWIKDEKPNFDLLNDKYGSSEVPVANCNERYYNAQSKCKMKLEKFLSYWKDYIKLNYDENKECLYMKDWHFALENPSEEVYRVPQYFASDWINEYLLSEVSPNDDYRFVYMGPKGSWTPLHADVFSSFSWSVNICGRKKWIFLPPGEEENLKDKFGQLAFDVNCDELKDGSKFPHSSEVKQILFIQEVGDAIFVPSGWHHQVWNLEDTISFNHNWVNGCNICQMWTALNDCFKSVLLEISDCADMDGWDDQCQLLLKSCFGMNHVDFLNFINYIAISRINSIKNKIVLRVNGNWSMSRNHINFDLDKIKKLLSLMLEANIICYQSLTEKIKCLINEIEEVII